MLIYNSFIFLFQYLSTVNNSIEILFFKANFKIMRIEEELKLDYSDVLFRPKRSTLKSRKDVNLLRTFFIYISGIIFTKSF